MLLSILQTPKLWCLVCSVQGVTLLTGFLPSTSWCRVSTSAYKSRDLKTAKCTSNLQNDHTQNGPVKINTFSICMAAPSSTVHVTLCKTKELYIQKRFQKFPHVNHLSWVVDTLFYHTDVKVKYTVLYMTSLFISQMYPLFAFQTRQFFKSGVPKPFHMYKTSRKIDSYHNFSKLNILLFILKVEK